jgi:dissimilatory sulfite reductase (desulfoviridin) alpha/beta subunit
MTPTWTVRSADGRDAATAPAEAIPPPADLKSGGIIPQRQAGLHSVRVRTPMGQLDSSRLRALADCAERFGSGEVHLTVRQTPEILDVPQEALSELLGALAAAGLRPAAAGPVVRAVSGCSGCRVTPNGLVDTLALGLAADTRFFGRRCPSKFKITFAGCPTDCVRAKGADMGFVGRVKVALDPESCKGCLICVDACREGALTSDEDGMPVIDQQRCLGCSQCVRACPVGALQAAHAGLDVYVGGKHGRRPRPGTKVATMCPEDDALELIERIISMYQEHGRPRERLGSAVDRLGIEGFAAAVNAMPTA